MGSMKKKNSRWSSFIMSRVACVLMLMMVMDGRVKRVSGEGLSPSQCNEERRLGLNACKPIVYGQPPSPACCQRIRVQHFECICPSITPKLASLVDINKAILLLKTCGRRVPRHFKCGSKITNSLPFPLPLY